ncbi:MAG: hypothetical protein U0230_03865 [Polyangiales bacterium]
MALRTLPLVAVLVLGLLGCGKDEAPPAAPPAASPSTPGLEAAPGTTVASYRPYDQGDPFVGSQGGIRVTGPAPSSTGAAPTEPAAAPAPERDLAGEVKRAFGDPSACVARSSELPESVTVTIQVRLTAFGTVSSASVAAPGLPSDAIDCLRRQAEGLRVAAPVSGAPKSVSTSVSMGRAPL